MSNPNRRNIDYSKVDNRQNRQNTADVECQNNESKDLFSTKQKILIGIFIISILVLTGLCYLSDICGCGLSVILGKPTLVGEYCEKAFKSFAPTNFATEKITSINRNNMSNLTRGS